MVNCAAAAAGRILAVRRGDDACRIDRLDRRGSRGDVGCGERTVQRPMNIALVLDVDEEMAIRQQLPRGGRDGRAVYRGRQPADVLTRERDVDDETTIARAVEDLEQPSQVRRVEAAVGAHQLRAFGRVRPEAYAVEPGVLQELKVRSDVLRAHRAEVGDEGEEARGAVDGESIADDGEPLSGRVARNERNGDDRRKCEGVVRSQ